MASYNEFESNVKQILITFNHFIDAYETENWLKSATIEDIKNSFKIANFIEAAMRDFEAKNCTKQFMEALHKDNCIREHKMEFFKMACDNLLVKFLTTKAFNINSTDIAVRIYTSMFPKERFEKVLTELVLMTNSYGALLDYMLVNSNELDSKELKARLLLNDWTKFKESKNVRDSINDILSEYKVEMHLPCLMKVLCLKDLTPAELKLQVVLLEILETKMLDRSTLSKNFWLTLFKTIDENELPNMCLQFESILDSVMNFIVYIGSMMNYEEHKWVGDTKASICPEITFTEMLKVIQSLCSLNEQIQQRVILRISKAQTDTESELWSEVLQLL